jgi:group I intron endonuclease
VRQTVDSHLYRAIRKHGVENFSFEIIEECSEELLNERETYWINFYESWDSKKGYNKTHGGTRGVVFTAETRKKLSEARIEYLADPEHRRKIGKQSRKIWAQRTDEERKIVAEKISEGKKAKGSQISKSLKERWSDETIRSKMIKSVEKSWTNPEIRTRHMEARGRNKQYREENNLYWVSITNGIKNRKILANKEGECDIPDGWKLGYIENRRRYMKCQTFP